MTTAFPRMIVGLLLGFVVLAGASTITPGQSAELAFAPDPKPVEATKPARSFQLQSGDDPLQKLDPSKPRSSSVESRVEATAWFMTGQLREKRNDFKGAYEAYKKAVGLDPNSIEIYRSLVPLAFSLNQTQDAVKFALKAVELDPSDYRLLRRLGVHLAGERKLAEALKLLEKAAGSSALNKRSGAYVTLNRDLAILYAAIGQIAKSADSYEVVFNALTHPRKFDLDFRTRTALLADPATTFERMGQVFFQAKRADLAVKAFEEAAKRKKGKPGTLSFNLANAYFQTKQYDKALTQLQKYFDAQLQSKGRAAYQLLADILKAQNKADQLTKRLEDLAEKDARNSTLQFFLADQYLAANRLDEAETLYKKELAGSGDSEGYVGLAGIYRRQNKPQQLLEALSNAMKGGRGLERLESEMQAIGKNKKLLESLIQTGRKLSEGDSPKLDFAQSLILAKLAARTDKTDAAIKFYRFALSARPDRAQIIYEELGQLLMAVDRFAEAVKVFQEAVNDPALAGSKANLLYRLSQAQAFNGDSEAALTAVREARKLIPDHPLLHYQEGWVFYHNRQWDKAIPIFEAVITKYPQQKEIIRRCQFSLSNIFVQQGNIQKGEQVLEQILAESPDDPSVNNDLGYLYADQGKNLEKAEGMIRKSITAEPENPAYLDSMGWVLHQLNRAEEAVPFLEKAVKLPGGSDATIWDHLGDCYDKLKKADKAVGAWKTALEKAKQSSRPDKELITKIEKKLSRQKESQKPKTESAGKTDKN